MANATVSQYVTIQPASGSGNIVPALREPNLASEKVTFTTSTQSSALNNDCRLVRIAAIDSGLHFKVGESPTATTEDPFIPQGGKEVIGVNPAGATLRIALIAAS